PQGDLLASVGSDYAIRLWRVRDRSLFAELRPLEAYNLSFSPDGQLLADSGGESITCFNAECDSEHTNIELWNIAEKGLFRVLDPTGRNIAFSPDAGMLVSVNASSGEVQIFDVNSGKLLSTWKTDRGVNQVFFSADGKQLITVRGR